MKALVFLTKISNTFRELGRVNGLLYGLSLLLAEISMGRARLIRYELVAQPVPAEAERRLRPSKTSQVEFVEAANPLVSEFPRPADVISRRFLDGQRCLAITSGGRFAGYLWLSRTSYEEDEVRCRYELAESATTAWDSDVYVAPDFRHGRTFARLWEAANQHLRSGGLTWSFSRISAFNQHSLRSHSQFGTRTLGTATFLCLKSVQLMFASVSPFVHLSFSTRSRPTLRLSQPRG